MSCNSECLLVCQLQTNIPVETCRLQKAQLKTMISKSNEELSCKRANTLQMTAGPRPVILASGESGQKR